MSSTVDGALEVLARKYLWWEPVDRALARRDLLLCQLMQLGTWDDLRAARSMFGDDAFRSALANAPPGVLDARSWNYWHLFFRMTPVPPLPTRPLPG